MEREPMLDVSTMGGNSIRQNGKSKPQKLTCFVYLLTFLSALGGFLFGYDTGVVSGALVVIKEEFHMSSLIQEVFVSITMGSAMIFALVSGFINDYLGRKTTILIASMTFLIGSLVLGFANSIPLLLIGRFIVGVGIGFASASIPMYIAECSPRSIRGQLVSINTLLITGGQFVSCLVCGVFSFDTEHGWRYMLGLAAIPALIQFVLFAFMPESPRWLYSRGRVEKARTILEKIERDESTVEEEIEDIRTSLISQAEETSVFTVLRIFKTPHVRRALLIGVMLQLIQQLVGINTVMYYSATIIQMSGTDDTSKAIWLAALVASVNFLFTFVGLFLVDKIGRRKLILLSLLGTIFSLVILGTGFLLASIHSPPVTFSTSSPSSCSKYLNCGTCVTDAHCGFCFDKAPQHNATCLPLPKELQFQEFGLLEQDLSYSNFSSFSGGFECGNSTTDSGWELITKFCPTKFAWMSTFGLIIYLAFFAPGMGPMPWTINSEIYPGWARSSGNSISSCANWLSNLLVSMTFLTLTETITTYGAFYLYASLALCGLLFLYLVLPETRGKSLEEIEDLFKEPLLIPCKKDYLEVTRGING